MKLLTGTCDWCVNADLKWIYVDLSKNYKDNTRQILNRQFTNELMARVNLKGNENKIGVLHTKICSVTVGK